MSSPVTTPPVALSIKGFRKPVENNDEEFDIQDYREIIEGKEIQSVFAFSKVLWNDSYPDKPLFVVLGKDGNKYAIKLGLKSHFRGLGTESKYYEVKKESLIYDTISRLAVDNEYFAKKISSGDFNDRWYYLIVEYIEGLDLEEYYHRIEYTLVDVFQICLHLSMALDVLLSINRIHGDIAFENIAIHPRTLKIKLLDFGSSSTVRDQTNIKKITRDILGDKDFNSRPLSDTGQGFIYIFAKLLEKIGKLDDYTNLINKIQSLTETCSTSCKDIYKNISSLIQEATPIRGGRRKTRKMVVKKKYLHTRIRVKKL